MQYAHFLFCRRTGASCASGLVPLCSDRTAVCNECEKHGVLERSVWCPVLANMSAPSVRFLALLAKAQLQAAPPAQQRLPGGGFQPSARRHDEGEAEVVVIPAEAHPGALEQVEQALDDQRAPEQDAQGHESLPQAGQHHHAELAMLPCGRNFGHRGRAAD